MKVVFAENTILTFERSGESAGTGVLLPASGVVEEVKDVLGDGAGGGDRRQGAELNCIKIPLYKVVDS